MPQKGCGKIMRFVEIGTNCCIDRPAVGFTFIDEGTKLDNLIQIGHGVKIGKNCAFAAQVGIAGGANIGDGVILAGQVGVNKTSTFLKALSKSFLISVLTFCAFL